MSGCLASTQLWASILLLPPDVGWRRGRCCSESTWGPGARRAFWSTPPVRFWPRRRVAHSMELPRPGWAEVDAEGDVVARGLRHQQRADGADAAGVGRGRGLCQRCRPVPRVVRRRPATTAARHPVRRRHPRYCRDRLADSGIREQKHPGAGGHGAVEPGRRAETGVGAPPRARGLRAGDRLVRLELLHRGQAHRRVRDGSPHRQPVRSAVRHAGVRLESPNGHSASARHLPLPRLVWPSEVVGTVHAAAAEATGFPRARRWSRAPSTPTPRRSRWASAARATRC